MSTRFDTSSQDGSRRGLFAASLTIHVLLIGVFPILLANFRKSEPPEPIEVVDSGRVLVPPGSIQSYEPVDEEPFDERYDGPAEEFRL